jgi:hypothetical protein
MVFKNRSDWLMAKVLTTKDGVTHLRGKPFETLCGDDVKTFVTTDGVLTCPDCAAIALGAVELVTKAEKREWRKL